MKTIRFVAAAIAASISAFTIAPAFAQGDAASTGQGSEAGTASPSGASAS